MPIWDDILSDRDRRIIAASCHAARRGLGRVPGVFVVDAQAHFVGVKDDIFASIAVYPTSIGRRAWEAVTHIQRLIECARRHDVPVMFSKSGVRKGEERFDSFARKRTRADVTGGVPPLQVEIVPDLAPRPGEVVIEKRYPSAFFGTPLISFLQSYGIDTLIVAGFTTSGCVRSTCVDAMSYNLNVGVVADACADRLEIAHKVSLLDIDMKFGDVMNTAEAVAYLQQVVPERAGARE